MALGTILRQNREEKGYTVAQVAEATHMMVQIVEELEAEDFSRIAAPIYGRGFIKLYAEFLNLDPEPLIDEFTAIYSGMRRPAVATRAVRTPQPTADTPKGIRETASAKTVAEPQEPVIPEVARPPVLTSHVTDAWTDVAEEDVTVVMPERELEPEVGSAVYEESFRLESEPIATTSAALDDLFGDSDHAPIARKPRRQPRLRIKEKLTVFGGGCGRAWSGFAGMCRGVGVRISEWMVEASPNSWYLLGTIVLTVAILFLGLSLHKRNKRIHLERAELMKGVSIEQLGAIPPPDPYF